jgi:hypothetical protein
VCKESKSAPLQKSKESLECSGKTYCGISSLRGLIIMHAIFSFLFCYFRATKGLKHSGSYNRVESGDNQTTVEMAPGSAAAGYVADLSSDSIPPELRIGQIEVAGYSIRSMPSAPCVKLGPPVSAAFRRLEQGAWTRAPSTGARASTGPKLLCWDGDPPRGLNTPAQAGALQSPLLCIAAGGPTGKNGKMIGGGRRDKRVLLL